MGNVCSVICLGWEPTLFSAADPDLDAGFAALDHRDLGEGAWIEVVPGWVSGAAHLFDRLVDALAWRSRQVPMYGSLLDEPRLTARWPGPSVDPLAGPLLERARAALSDRYGVPLTGPGANLYRDGDDSVAWHGDRVARERATALVAILSLGEARPLRLRPVGGGASIGFALGHGDLFVMGGTCQRTWQHAVPKVRQAGPRLSLTFRHGC